MVEEQGRLGQFQLKQDRTAVICADQVDTGIGWSGLEWQGGQHAQGQCALVPGRLTRLDGFRCIQLIGGAFIRAQQCTLADGMAVRAIKVDQRGLADFIHAIQIRLQHHRALRLEQARDVGSHGIDVAARMPLGIP